MSAPPPPFPHQATALAATRDLRAYALLWEMGTGKSRVTLDTFAHALREGKATALLIVAPNGVHRNWITSELPCHWAGPPVVAYSWASSRTANRAHAEAVRAMLAPGPVIVAMSYDALLTPAAERFVGDLLRAKRVFLVLDESQRIKTPSAARTRTAIALSRRCSYVRILTGTPVANSPFDLYSQFRALDPDYWRPWGLGTFTAFKATFGVWRRAGRPGARQWDELVQYRDLDRLGRMVAPASSRLTKEAAGLALPPKLYTRRTFELSGEQARHYEALRTDLTTMLDGHEVTAMIALVQLLRLQQVTCGYLPSGSSDVPLVSIPGSNPRLDLLREIVTDLPHQVIVWVRFRRDADLICAAIPGCARYDGTTAAADRERALERFHSGEARIFVGNPAAIGMGVTLTEAKTVIYYSSSFSLTDRLQSEDRAHRIGQTVSVQVIDLVAEGTVDEHILDALATKDTTACAITGDRLREWIR